MAHWNITNEAGLVKLSYVADPRRPEVQQQCGEGPSSLLPDLEAWVFDQAQPYDIIHAPEGRFVRQTMVNRNRPATA